jgi:hypothetical protein
MDNIDRLIKELQEAKEELNKAIRDPLTGVSPMKWPHPSTEGASKPAKPQGGDPKHDPDNMGRKTRKGSVQVGKETSGSSSLRWGTKNDPYKKMQKEEDVEKNVNESYSGPSNMDSGAAMKADGLDDRWSKRKDVGDGRVVTGAEPSPKSVDKQMRGVAEKHDKSDGTKSGYSPKPEAVDSQMRSVAMKGDPSDGNDIAIKAEDDVLKCGEYFTLFKNGQWSMSKAEKVMPLTPAIKESKKASPKGLPYAGEKKKA